MLATMRHVLGIAVLSLAMLAVPAHTMAGPEKWVTDFVMEPIEMEP